MNTGDNIKLDAAAFRKILDNIEYAGREGWTINIKFDDKRPYLQIESHGGDLAWTGRKWFLSPHMCVTEVVRTAFKAVLAAEEHEACENFKYVGAAIFSPHISVDALVMAADEIDTREERSAKI